MCLIFCRPRVTPVQVRNVYVNFLFIAEPDLKFFREDIGEIHRFQVRSRIVDPHDKLLISARLL